MRASRFQQQRKGRSRGMLIRRDRAHLDGDIQFSYWGSGVFGGNMAFSTKWVPVRVKKNASNQES